MRHALGNPAHDLGFCRLQSGLGRFMVAGRDGFLNFPGRSADPGEAGVVDGRPLGGRAGALFGRGDIGPWSSLIS